MRSLIALLLYAIARHIWPGLAPRHSGNVSEYDPTVRRFITLLNNVPQTRGPECHPVEYDLEDTQEYYPDRTMRFMDELDARREGFDTPTGESDQ